MAIEIESVLNKIYKEIFLKEKDSTINVFLCGKGADRADDKESIRCKINEKIKDDPKYNVVFPEWLFGSLLDKKEYNLLKLEQRLAEEVDIIILPLEGLGTYAELGAFASNPDLCGKILLINDKCHRHKRSFINIGPIKLIKEAKRKNISKNIIYYEKKFDAEDLKIVVNKIKYLRNRIPKENVSNLFNLSRFLLYLIALFQPLAKNEIEEYIKQFTKSINTYYIDPCIEILIRKQKIQSDFIEHKEVFILTEPGHSYVYEDLLHSLNLVKSFSKIRLEILNEKLKTRRRINFWAEGDKFLVCTSGKV